MFRTVPMSVAATAVALIAAPAAADEIVYDSIRGGTLSYWAVHDSNGETSSSVELPGGFEEEARAGNAVTLAGTGRFITGFELRMLRRLFAPHHSHSAHVTVRFFEVVDDRPGALLWSGGEDFEFQVGHRDHLLSFTPNVTVPDDVIWTFELDDIGSSNGVSFGVATNQFAPHVGGVETFVLWQHSTTQEWHADPGSGILALEARFTAIPAPSAGALGLALALAAGRRRRC